MTFRSVIVLSLLAMVIGIVALTSMVAASVVDSDARAALDEELTRGGLVFEELIEHRHTLLLANAKVVSEEPRLKAVVATEDIDHATVIDVSTDLRRAIGSDLFLMTDPDGRLIADVAEPDAVGFDLSHKPLVAEAMTGGTARGIWMADGRVYLMASQGLAFGETVVGVLVMGWEVGDDLAAAAARQTGAAVVVLEGERTVASSLPPETTRGELPSELSEQGAHVTLTVDGGLYRAATGLLEGDERLRFLVLRSLDEALATTQRLVQQIYGIGAGAVLVSILLALWISRRLSRPLDGLVEFTRKIAGGDLDQRHEPRGPRELSALGEAMNRMAGKLSASRDQLAATERLEKEMEIARRIQTSIVPTDPVMPGYSIAAAMKTATEVGGDYYDVIATETAHWVAIGDVAGHGLPAGIVMLMVQSGTSVLVDAAATESPAALVARLNAFLYDNIRVRLGQDEHVTYTLLRCSDGGEVVYAGAHEDILVWRSNTEQVEHLPTRGPWLGVLDDVAGITEDDRFTLEPGDVMLLYTDGITEAKNEAREQFGLDRLCALLSENASDSAEALVQRVHERVEDWSRTRHDDITVVVVRYEGVREDADADADDVSA